jgi:hypothetical protein
MHRGLLFFFDKLWGKQLPFLVHGVSSRMLGTLGHDRGSTMPALTSIARQEWGSFCSREKCHWEDARVHDGTCVPLRSGYHVHWPKGGFDRGLAFKVLIGIAARG